MDNSERAFYHFVAGALKKTPPSWRFLQRASAAQCPLFRLKAALLMGEIRQGATALRGGLDCACVAPEASLYFGPEAGLLRLVSRQPRKRIGRPRL